MEITEEFYNSVIDNMMNGFAYHSIITDNDGNPIDYRYIQVNRAFEEFTGLRREDILGRTLREFMPSIDHDSLSWVKFFGEVALSGNPNVTEQYSQAFDRWYSVSAFCPQIGYFIAVFVDITELKEQAHKLQMKHQELRKVYKGQSQLYRELQEKNEQLLAAQKEIERNERRLSKAQQIAHVGNWEVDLATGRFWASDETRRIYEIDGPRRDIDFKEVIEKYAGQNPDELREYVRSFLEEGIGSDMKVEIRTVKGTVKHIHSLLETEKDAKGKHTRLLGVVRDITKDVADELELKNKNDELSSLYEELLASEEELRQQNDELLQKKEEITALYEELLSQEEELRSNYSQLNDSMVRLNKMEETNKLIIEATSEGVWQYDIAEDRYTISSQFAEGLGYQTENFPSIYYLDRIIHPEDREYSSQVLSAYLSGKAPKYEVEFRFICKDGSHRWVKSSGKVLRDTKGKPYLMAGSFIDITRMKEQQSKLEHLAYHDMLTDLPNRTLFLKEMEQAQLRADREKHKLAVIYMDLDNFKDVNDMLGHSTGDRLLQIMADRLRGLVSGQEIVTRLGGDEFAILLVDINSEQEAYHYCLRMKESVLKPFEFNGYRLNISPSMGVVMYPDITGSSEDLLKNADVAMYRAKNMGKNNIQFYRDSIRTDILKRMTIESHLREALHQERFTLNYQPQICLKNGKIRGFEALVRWTDEELGVLSPAEFIPIAEGSGLIVPMGEWILYEACRQAKEFCCYGIDFLISVNISAIQLKQTDFVHKVKKILNATGLPARHLELEVTETMMISSFDSSIIMLEELRGLGIKISLDDFGTGYSSLSYLKKLPIDVLKIDRSFIHDLDSEQFKNAITGAIISLVHELDIEVIAEGVETGKQLEYLHQCGCDSIQGYLMSKPVPAWNVPALFERDFAKELGIKEAEQP